MRKWKGNGWKESINRLMGWVGAAGVIATMSYLVPSMATAQVLVPSGTGSVTLTDEGIQFQGTTTGSYGLMRLAGRDRRRRLCLGYGSEQPSHVLVLAEDANRLNLAVESDGDTTLLVEGPRGIDCNDNYRRNSRDAAVRDGRWPAGTYRIWVGAFEKGDRISYKLLVSQPANNR